MNIITIHGRLVRDPDTKFFDGDKAVCNISVAVDRAFKDKDGNAVADFFNCFCFNKQAEIIDKYFKKGDGITIVGEMQNNKYTDKDGNNRDKWQIKIDKFDFELIRREDSGKKEVPHSQPGEFIPTEIDDDEDSPF